MPWSTETLAEQLRALGLGNGHTVLVHSSLREIGEVAGGGAGLVAALQQVIGAEGTIMVPTLTEANSKTSRAHRKRIKGLSRQEVEEFRADMQPFDVASTPTDAGRLAELIRLMPGAVRSAHPVTSFAALGPGAAALVADHALNSYHGAQSPLGRLYQVPRSQVLLAGVDYGKCSAFHLAEYRLPDQPLTRYEFVLDEGDGPRWHAVDSIYLDDSDFVQLGAAVDAQPGLAAAGRLGFAEARLLPMAPAVDFAVSWLTAHRSRRRPRTPT
jgi:aminoglycoside 3-N-acetyltransferase